jgi:hypothetical protein
VAVQLVVEEERRWVEEEDSDEVEEDVAKFVVHVAVGRGQIDVGVHLALGPLLSKVTSLPRVLAALCPPLYEDSLPP